MVFVLHFISYVCMCICVYVCVCIHIHMHLEKGMQLFQYSCLHTYISPTS